MPYAAHHHRPRPEHNPCKPPRPRSGRYRRRQTVQNRLPLQNYTETDHTRLSMTVPFTLISGLDYAGQMPDIRSPSADAASRWSLQLIRVALHGARFST